MLGHDKLDDHFRNPKTNRFPETHTFGAPTKWGSEGAGALIAWKPFEKSKDPRPDRDFRKLNKMSVASKACTAHDTYRFR